MGYNKNSCEVVLIVIRAVIADRPTFSPYVNKYEKFVLSLSIDLPVIHPA
jgi:hypothetical protein